MLARGVDTVIVKAKEVDVEWDEMFQRQVQKSQEDAEELLVIKMMRLQHVHN